MKRRASVNKNKRVKAVEEEIVDEPVLSNPSSTSSSENSGDHTDKQEIHEIEQEIARQKEEREKEENPSMSEDQDNQESENENEEQKQESEDDDENDKKELFPSESEEINDEFSENEFEKAAKQTIKEEAQVKKEAEEELLTNVAEEQRYVLPSGQEVVKSREFGDMATIGTRIREVVAVLNDFKNKREEGRSRQEYVNLLIQDIQTYYSCNEFLANFVVDLFGPKAAVDFMEANETPRPTTIRVNTLKSKRRDLAQKLIAKGVNVDMIEWCKSGLVVYESQIPIGATVEYLSGMYILQSSSSWAAVIALAPQPNERILDMCSAPGGKSTHIAALMKNTGTLVANDVSKDRLKAVVGNVQRLGITNTIVTSYDGHEFPKVMGGFDRVLVDAPCTGLGIISKDSSVKLSKSEADLRTYSKMQKELLLHAIDSVNPKSATGGYVVYSTCSVSVQENEAVVDYALRKRNVKVVPIDLQEGVGEPGMVGWKQYHFNPSIKLARRFLPHVQNMDGFFVCKLKLYVEH
ncbi:hypothetical protein EIN_399460 [Entamoeba invadens IP1]|uniref:SAM-dependent MTase RsmB/NOP-type domain-containing protein n=2 Tax=Entamoeba invadens TaxID=33085 RepID=A0A0A1UDP0_ENTIV|nr:hypothetical protein EIN_399460 [Entamoeba invadens IP1]ELP91916.1 hypothetical protein EIN_399460 [Entamoeba invadens IP1]BAN41693.1 hypothetical protein, conserved [Entamoeba invadens]|eukprot:XP_004258687.1 hypothetical protein EIN_399460 [Entamoeba invadens IP1]